MIFSPRAASVVMGMPRLSPPVRCRSVAASASVIRIPAARPPHSQGRRMMARAKRCHPPVTSCRGPALEHPARDHAPTVHAPSHHRQDRRQEGGRGGDRDERDEHAAHPHRAHERHGHEDEQAEADGHGQAREQRRAPGGGHGLDQRGVRVVVDRELLAIAEHDEHRVVDRDREADQRDDVRHVDGHVHRVGEDPHEAERRGDAHEGEDERHDDPADRAEHERHDEDRDGHGDRLALAEVLVVDRLRVVVERGIAGQVRLGPRHGADRLAQLRRLLGGVLVLERGRDLHVGDGRARLLDGACAAALDRIRRAARCRGDRQTIGRGALSLHHQRERPVGALVHVVLEEGQPALGVRARHAEAVGEQVAEVRGGRATDDEEGDPRRDDCLPVADDREGPARHRA